MMIFLEIRRVDRRTLPDTFEQQFRALKRTFRRVGRADRKHEANRS